MSCAVMSQHNGGDSRTRLLNAAAELIAASPGEDFSLRAVCEAAGVQLPTLYHFFGNKRGLVDAVVERGFDLYLGRKTAHASTGDALDDIRSGWDEHVAFGIENPGFYTLMYGKVRPGYSPPAQDRPTALLQSLTRRAHEQGRLVVPAAQATAHILVANVGVTLWQIVRTAPDPTLSRAVREGVIAAVTGTSGARDDIDGHLRAVTELVAADPAVLGAAETPLMLSWLRRLRSRPIEGP